MKYWESFWNTGCNSSYRRFLRLIFQWPNSNRNICVSIKKATMNHWKPNDSCSEFDSCLVRSRWPVKIGDQFNLQIELTFLNGNSILNVNESKRHDSDDSSQGEWFQPGRPFVEKLFVTTLWEWIADNAFPVGTVSSHLRAFWIIVSKNPIWVEPR